MRELAVRMSEPQNWCPKCLNKEYDMVNYPKTHNAKMLIKVPQHYIDKYEREQAALKKKAEKRRAKARRG